MSKSAVTTVGKNTGKDVFYIGTTIFLGGSEGFDGQARGENRAVAIAANKIPSCGLNHVRVVEEKTTGEQAAIYRLLCDYNSLHMDPALARWVGGPTA